MKQPIAVSALSIFALALLAACKPPASPQTPAVNAGSPPAAAAVPTVFEAMVQTFTPRSNTLWELAGSLYGENGELDPKQLSEQQWQDLASAAGALREAARALAEAPAVKVAPEGVKLQNEDAPGAFGAAQVQAAIDAAPQGFRDESLKLVAVAEEFITAAAAHDAVKADEASNGLNEVCTACHTAYWYPGQPGG